MGRLERVQVAESGGLSWLNDVLWPDEGAWFRALEGAEPPSQADGRSAPTWWASPSATNPHTLIPTSPASSARRAVRRYHDGQTFGQRCRSLAAEALLWARPSFAFGPFSERVELLGDPQAGIVGGLGRALEVESLTFAVTLGAPKSNRKPIVQLLAQGECLGFAKVATNTWTEGLLRNEAAWLERAASGRQPLAVPELIFADVLCSRFVLVQAPVLPPRLPRRRHIKPPPAALFDAIADLGHSTETTLAHGQWWSEVERLLHHATPREREAIDQARTALDLPLRTGAWHGDLTPWNLFTVRGHVSVIDWEFAAPDVPFGFDVCHFHLQTANELLGANARESLEWARERSRLLLAELGMPSAHIAAVWRLYLVELLRRHLKLRSDGIDADITHGPAAADWLCANPDKPISRDADHA